MEVAGVAQKQLCVARPGFAADSDSESDDDIADDYVSQMFAHHFVVSEWAPLKGIEGVVVADDSASTGVGVTGGSGPQGSSPLASGSARVSKKKKASKASAVRQQRQQLVHNLVELCCNAVDGVGSDVDLETLNATAQMLAIKFKQCAWVWPCEVQRSVIGIVSHAHHNVFCRVLQVFANSDDGARERTCTTACLHGGVHVGEVFPPAGSGVCYTEIAWSWLLVRMDAEASGVGAPLVCGDIALRRLLSVLLRLIPDDSDRLATPAWVLSHACTPPKASIRSVTFHALLQALGMHMELPSFVLELDSVIRFVDTAAFVSALKPAPVLQDKARTDVTVSTSESLAYLHLSHDELLHTLSHEVTFNMGVAGGVVSRTVTGRPAVMLAALCGVGHPPTKAADPVLWKARALSSPYLSTAQILSVGHNFAIVFAQSLTVEPGVLAQYYAEAGACFEEASAACAHSPVAARCANALRKLEDTLRRYASSVVVFWAPPDSVSPRWTVADFLQLAALAHTRQPAGLRAVSLVGYLAGTAQYAERIAPSAQAVTFIGMTRLQLALLQALEHTIATQLRLTCLRAPGHPLYAVPFFRVGPAGLARSAASAASGAAASSGVAVLSSAQRPPGI